MTDGIQMHLMKELNYMVFILANMGMDTSKNH